MRPSNPFTTWPAALAMLILRYTCRIRLHNDPRPALRTASERYVYSVLHAHQISAAIDGERGTAAMVSRSKDGELIVLGLRMFGIKAIRGSSQRDRSDKGGRSALKELVAHVASGCPAYMAVDGPRGPRNRVHKGIAVLSQETGAAVINVVAIPNRRWIFARAWDRFQIPVPFCRIDAHFGEPIRPQAGENVEDYRRRIEISLNQLERTWDPDEAVRQPSVEPPLARRRPGPLKIPQVS